ncbi:MAG: HAD-IIIA family hydrolase [Lachnospiraceae bacterium]|jgi:D-glycero-D-manno-heptose 1,7-bisphosphate phosphatase|nr:HAD-IIIA family hydrolase [Lachnospiraceae bacterium]
MLKAAIQAGGIGSRLAEYYPDLPKPMIPLNGKPLLQHQVEALVGQGFAEITLIVGYKADIIKEHFGDGAGFGAKISYITEHSPLGTGGALALLPKEDTLLLFGDVYCDVDFQRFVEYHQTKKAAITLFVHPNSHPHDSDIVITADDGRVLAWASKKDRQRGDLRNLVNAGLYVFAGSALPSGAAEKCDLEHDIITARLDDSKVYAYRSSEYVKDMGTPERLAQVENDIKSGIASARSLQRKQKAVFIDRDGTINVFSDLVTKPQQLGLLDGAAEAIRLLNQSEYLAICVTNQPIIARGDVTFAELTAIHARLDTLLGEQGAYLDDLIFCPHHPDRGFAGERRELKIDCNCRKPKPGMLLKAAKRYNIDLTQSYMIGDSDRDIGAGQAAGCGTVGIGEASGFSVAADMYCDSLLAAVRQIR